MESAFILLSPRRRLLGATLAAFILTGLRGGVGIDLGLDGGSGWGLGYGCSSALGLKRFGGRVTVLLREHLERFLLVLHTKRHQDLRAGLGSESSSGLEQGCHEDLDPHVHFQCEQRCRLDRVVETRQRLDEEAFQFGIQVSVPGAGCLVSEHAAV